MLETASRSDILTPVSNTRRFQALSRKVSPDIGGRNSLVEASAYSGYANVLQTSDLESSKGLCTFCNQAYTYSITGLAREDSFPTLSSTVPETIRRKDTRTAEKKISGGGIAEEAAEIRNGACPEAMPSHAPITGRRGTSC